MLSCTSIYHIGLAPLDALINPFPMQQALTIWKACTANDPIQQDEDDRVARASIDGNIITPVMVVASIKPTEAGFDIKSLAIQVSDEPVNECAITATKTVVEYEPIEAILVGNAEPKNKAAHVRTDSASSTSSTTSNVSSKTTDSNWSTSTSSTAASDFSVAQELEDCVKTGKDKGVNYPVMDNDIHVFTLAVPSIVAPEPTTSNTDATTDHHEEPTHPKSRSVFELMALFGVNKDQLTNAHWDEIMMYEADHQRKQKRGTKIHCQEVFVESAAAVESQTA